MIGALLAHPLVGHLARLALCSPFLVSGVLKLADFAGATAEVRALTGIETAAPVAVLVILTQLGGSLLVIAGGRHAWLGAVLLGGFTLVATILGHPFWARSGPERMRDMMIFIEHMGLIGGFVLAAILSVRRTPTGSAA